MSLRLTLCVGTENEALVDSIAQGLKSTSVSVEVSHNTMNGRNAAVAHADRDANCQTDGVSALIMAEGGEVLKRDNRRPIIHRDGLYSSVVGNLV